MLAKDDSGAAGWLPLLRQRPKDQPFFLWFAALDPHRDYVENSIANPHNPSAVIVPPYLPDAPEVRQELALYYDEITRLDDYVGKVLAELERQKVADNTLVLFMSDNGRPFPRAKTTLYDSGIKTPLIARWPQKIRRGTVAEGLVSSIDIAPTILQLAGLPIPPTVQGQSFAPTLTNPKVKTRDAIYAEKNWHDYEDRTRAVRTERFKYIRNDYPDLPLTTSADSGRSPTMDAIRRLRKEGKLTLQQSRIFQTPRPTEELYDVQADPHEFNNLAAEARYASTLKELREKLNQWGQATNDVMPPRRTPDEFDRETGQPLPNRVRPRPAKKEIFNQVSRMEKAANFEELNGMVAVEAEHFLWQEKAEKRQWYRVTDNVAPALQPDGDDNHAAAASGNAYLEILPDTRRTHNDKLIHGENFTNKPGEMAIVNYRVWFNTPGRYYVWVRAFSTGPEDNGIHVGLDGMWPESGARMQWCEGKNAWRWESKQRTEANHCGEPQKIFLDIPSTGWHTVSFSMREDGFEFDKWLLTTDAAFTRPQDAGPAVKVKTYTSNWETLQPQQNPTARHEAAFTAIGEKFYLLGGRGIKPVEEYDPVANTWRQLAPPPIEMHHFQALSFDKKIYVIGALTGGYPGETPLPNVYIFDPAKNAWEKGAEIPAARRRGSAGIVADKGKVYVIGGLQDGHRGDFVPWIDEWNPRTNQWRQLPDAPRPRDHFHAVSQAGRIYAAGGRTTSQRTNHVFDLTIAEIDVYDVAKGRWETLPTKLPTPRAGCTAFMHNNRLIIAGGESGTTALAHPEVEALDLKTLQWAPLSPLNRGRHGTQAIVFKEAVYLAAGCGRRGGNPELDSMELLRLL